MDIWSFVKEWALKEICHEFKREEWELIDGDRHYDYYLYDLKDEKQYYISEVDGGFEVFQNPVYIF